MCAAETEQDASRPAECETESVVGDDEREGQQDRRIQQVPFANQADHDEEQQSDQAEAAERRLPSVGERWTAVS